MISKGEAKSDTTTYRTRSVSDEEISELLEDMVDPRQGRIGVFETAEVAEIINKVPRHARRFITGERPLTAGMFANLCREANERGDRRLLDLLLPVGATLSFRSEVATNGSVDDELGQKTEYEGKMRAAFNSGNLVEAQYWNDKAKETQGDIDQEIARKGSK